MILGLLWALLFVFLPACGFVVFLVGVSRQGTAELESRCYGYQLVNAMETNEFYKDLMQRRGYCRAFNKYSLEKLTREVQELTKQSGHPLALLYLAAFHVLRLAILLKGRIAPGSDDLRVVVGLQVLLARIVR